jgi:DNA-binding transcriptional MerR regulator
MKYEISIYTGPSPALYPAQIISQLSRISLQFLKECDQQGLIQGYNMLGGVRGYRLEDVAHLSLIRRLSKDLELDYNAIEIVLNMRQQIISLHTELQAVHLKMQAREQEFQEEIRQLRETIL